VSEFPVEGLRWLPLPPPDLRVRIRDIERSLSDRGAGGEADNGGPQNSASKTATQELLALAKTALGLDQLLQVSRALDRSGASLDQSLLSPMRLALLVDGTTDYVGPAIRASALRHGVLAEIYSPAYGQALSEVMNPASGLMAFRPEVALVASDYRSLGLATPMMDAAAAANAVNTAVARLSAIVTGLARSGATVILQSVAVPPDPWCGHLDRGVDGSPAAQVRAVNQALAALAKEQAAVLLDGDALAGLVGRGRWFDHAMWYRAKVPFALDFVPLYADHVARLLGAIRGKSRKCLVLDLDNTCWGGVVGDDGVDGIRLGQGSAEGEAFLAIQAYALGLKARGIVLAVVSKNEKDAARLPFLHHPDMLLREDDISVFIADWNDKATNIAHVAKRLNIGVDALVFLDDNPAERARVRQMLPEVAVPELPEDPSGYPIMLAQSGVFETIGLSADDARRGDQYRENAARAVALEQIGDYDGYLRSLGMVCDMRPFDEAGRIRIAQLVNKSNQFNLTTTRYSEADISAIQADAGNFALQIRLTDRFGDNGMISVVIFRKGKDEWLCGTWLMSCRVLERRVEEAVLMVVAQAAKAEGASRLVGTYLPTAKNRMVAEHFKKLGFAYAGQAGEDLQGTRWVLELDSYAAPDLPMTLNGPGAPAARTTEAALHE
jgi:FkbH-like protein